jgi:hypothetical protein
MLTLVQQKPTLQWKESVIDSDQRFTRERIARSDKILDTYLFNLAKARETSEMWKAIEVVTKAFNKLNMEADGFLDMEEREELAGFIKYAAEMYGLKYEGDVTEEYRMEW